MIKVTPLKVIHWEVIDRLPVPIGTLMHEDLTLVPLIGKKKAETTSKGFGIRFTYHLTTTDGKIQILSYIAEMHYIVEKDTHVDFKTIMHLFKNALGNFEMRFEDELKVGTAVSNQHITGFPDKRMNPNVQLILDHLKE